MEKEMKENGKVGTNYRENPVTCRIISDLRYELHWSTILSRAWFNEGRKIGGKNYSGSEFDTLKDISADRPAIRKP